MNYKQFFAIAFGGKEIPLPYQIRLAICAIWPNALNVATGLGKTAAVVLAWLYRKIVKGDAATPTRLVWCLPMRGLVEQTASKVMIWLHRLGLEEKVAVHLLMGGADDVLHPTWAEYPERPTIIIGTQDILLSRALMRGYGMSRYQWAVHFAQLHNDSLWVFDEIQLMGPALTTTAQLEAFRQKWPTAKPSRSLWLSATMQIEWLATVDFKTDVAKLRVEQLNKDDLATHLVKKRVKANKRLGFAETVLNRKTNKKYIKTLAAEILNNHRPGSQTLVILNLVERCQFLFKILLKALKGKPTSLLLVHGRFRPKERKRLEREMRKTGCDRIIVSSQASEAGVDISSSNLFTELAPWSSIVQRFGRNNRYGEDDGARIFLIDLDETLFAAPYPEEDLVSARLQARGVVCSGDGNAAPASLPDVASKRKSSPVIRNKDFFELFNTDADLTGFDIDISPFIRDTGTPSLQVFWRDFEDVPVIEAFPQRDELCPVSISQAKGHISQLIKKINKPVAWRRDSLNANDSGWIKVNDKDIRPGMILLLRAEDGGYDVNIGFQKGIKGAVPSVEADGNTEKESYESDSLSRLGSWVPLEEHLDNVRGEAEKLCLALEESPERAQPVIIASHRHDTGKGHPANQSMLTHDQVPPKDDQLWAKSPRRPGRAKFMVPGEGESRRYFRHELASMLSWLESEPDHRHRDLVAYLIAAHHGKVRMGLRALPKETRPKDDRLFARGIWEGDCLPEIQLSDKKTLPETRLRLDLIQLGEGAMGPSWASRTHALLTQYGPFVLAWMETLVRIADWRASKQEDDEGRTL